MSQMNPFAHSDMLAMSPWQPYNPQVKFFLGIPPYVHPFYYTNWREENMSWKKSCYIFAGLNLTPTGYITGPDVIRLLCDCTTHSFKKFPIGKTKHSMICDDNGNIVMHGLVLRTAEEQVWSSTLYPWIVAASKRGSYDVKFESTSYTRFIFQLGGAATLNALEAATGEDLHDIPFLGFRDSSICGKKVRILRMTMCGTLGYEVHGDTADAKEIYQYILEAGKAYGMVRIGWLGYTSNITEGAMPQEVPTFRTAAINDEFYLSALREQGYNTDFWPGHPQLLGSSANKGIEHYFRTPYDMGWDVSVTFDHEFPGKEALMKLKEKPERRTVTLVWNKDDVMDIHASYYQKEEEPYKWIDYPCPAAVTPGQEQDEVFDMEGNCIGVSTNVQYTEYSREMLSLGTISVDYIEPGTQVQVLWGDPGTRQKLIRATVAVYPYLDLPTNMKFDVETIPHIHNN